MHTPSAEHLDISTLSLGARIELAQKLWESVRENVDASPLTADQVIEVERRIADIDSGRVGCVPFDDMMTRLSRR